MKTLSLLFVLVSPSVRAEVPASSGQEFEVPEISVTGAGPEFDAPVTPAVRLSGRKLERKKQSTLGETLSREVGVSSTFFGPNSSRPVIRGLDGDRVRLLENGIG
ncbi:TonB-dependent receptor, partial [bacterium]|nr:TonB-dependent receptor [bacterium]